MPLQSTDLLVIERAGTLYKAQVSDLPSGGGGGGTTIAVGTTPPASPAIGDLWVDTN